MCSCVQNISSTEVKKARKLYHCMASDFVREDIVANRQDYKLTFSEWRKIIMMKAKGWKILKGEPYHCEINKQDGEIYAFRANKEMLDICVKYGLFPCDC